MKAAILKDWKRIELDDVAAPHPGPGEVLIDVAYAGICGSDVHIFNGDNPIARTPVVPGHEFSGRISELGDGVEELQLGTRAAIQPLKFCGNCTPCHRGSPHVCENLIVIGVNQDGGFAEQTVVPVDCIFPISDSLADETAALAEPFSVATHSLKRGGFAPSDRVLIIGAGPIGLYAAVTASYLGVRQLHVSEPNMQRRAVAASCGIASTNPVERDALQELKALSDGQGFDLVVETSGTSSGFEFATNAAAVQGRIVALGFPPGGKTDLHITRCIIKELSLIGSRVCTRVEFGETLAMLSAMQSGNEVDFANLIADTRPLQELNRSILEVGNGVANAKILIQPD